MLLPQCLDFSQHIFTLLVVDTHSTVGFIVMVQDHQDGFFAVFEILLDLMVKVDSCLLW